MEETKLVLTIETQNAEKNLDNVKGDLDEVKAKVEEVNETAEEGTLTVGNYGNAFESAFNSIGGQVAKTNKGLGNLFQQVKNAIPIVKNLNRTALSGLTGIKAAIASTGIGLLVVAVGELVAHWKDVAKWLGVSVSEQDRLTAAAEATERAVSKISDQYDYQVRLLAAQGATRVEQAELALQGAQRELDVIVERIELEKSLGTRMSKIKDAYEEQYKAATKNVQKAKENLKIAKAQEATNKRAKEEAEQEAAAKAAASKAQKTQEDAVKKRMEEQLKILTNMKGVYTAIQDLIKNAKENDLVDLPFWENLLKPETENIPAFELLNKLISEMGLAGQEIGEIQESLTKDAIKGNTTILNNYSNLQQERIKIIKLGGVEEYMSEADRAQAIYDIQKDLYEKEIALYEDSLKAATTFTNNPDLINALEDTLKLLKVKYETFQLERIDEEINIEKEKLTKEEELNEKYYEHKKDIINIEVDWATEKNAKLYALEQERLEQHKEYLESLLNLTQTGTDEYNSILQQIVQTDNAIAENKARIEENTREQIRETIQTYADMADSIGSLLGQVADIEKQNLDQRVKNGEISEGQAKKEFERIKKLELAQVWIQTLAGSVGAFLQASAAYPPPYGQIIGGITAATVLASGIAQHAQIQATQYGSSSTGGGSVGGNTPSVGRYLTVEPEASVDQSSTLSTAQAVSAGSEDQKVYILESDIQDSNKRVEIRESESTW